jgi:hypothetical protein
MGVAQPASVTGALGSALGAAFHSLAGPDSGFADNALTTGVALLSGNVPGLASTVAKLATHPSTIIKGIKATMDAIGITNPAPQEMNGLLQWWMELPELAKIMIAGGGGLLAGAAISKMMGGPAALPAIAGAAGLAGGLSAAGEFGDQGNILKQLGWGGGAVTQPGKQNTSTSLMQALGMMPKPAVSTAPKAVFNPLAGVKPLGIDRPK